MEVIAERTDFVYRTQWGKVPGQNALYQRYCEQDEHGYWSEWTGWVLAWSNPEDWSHGVSYGEVIK